MERATETAVGPWSRLLFAPNFPRAIKALAVVVLIGAVAGCSGASPYERKVQAGSQIELSLWRAKVGRDLSPREWRLFDRALQEMRFRVMMDKKVSGSVDIGKAVFARIDGRSLYQVMQSGLNLRLERIAAEKEEFDELYHRVERVRTRPGDDESADYIAWVRRTHAEKKGRLDADVAEAKQDLADLKRFAQRDAGSPSKGSDRL